MKNFSSADFRTSPTINQFKINPLICAVESELTARLGKRRNEANFLMMGGGTLSPAEMDALATFACQKNWNLLHAATNTTDPVNGFVNGEIEFTCVVTDGFTSTAILSGGKLWKRDRSSAAMLLFPQHRVAARLNSKGLLSARKFADRYHDQGYDLAKDAVLQRLPGSGDTTPVITMIGAALVVHDVGLFKRMVEFA